MTTYSVLEFTLQRVRRPCKLKLELQRPDDAIPAELLNYCAAFLQGCQLYGL